MLQQTLSDAQVQQYRTEGFIFLEHLISQERLGEIDAAIDELCFCALNGGSNELLEWEPELVDGRRMPRRLYDPYDQHDAFRRLANDERVVEHIKSLIGPNINLHHSKLNMKPAHVGSAVEWHQDLTYFPHTNDDLVTALIYLDDATEDNGCLQVLPRHHFHYFDHTLPDGTFAGLIAEDLSSGRFGRPVSLPAPAGSVIFMHCLTPHSSLPNRSSQRRRTLIFEYRAGDAFPIYHGEPTAKMESRYRPIRGKRSAFARFGGPPPLIPVTGQFSSLYDLQAQSRAKTQDRRRVPGNRETIV